MLPSFVQNSRLMKLKKTNFEKGSLFLLLIFLISGLWLVVKFGDFNSQFSGLKQYDSTDVSEQSCVQCHVQFDGFSKFHDPKLIGCVVCHLGNPMESDKTAAHKDMVLIPGNLNNAKKTCGTCHPNELDKIEHSLMTTNSGLVAVDKYVFGEVDSPDHPFDIRELEHSQADDHLRNLCANCHLGAEKSDLGPIDQLSRGGGCNACHLNYSKEASSQLSTYIESNREVLPTVHPATNIQITDEHCFGCHSRSSRISTNYMGWHETLLDAKEAMGIDSLRVFEDKRVYQYVSDDVHHSKGMLCIDCHSSHEVMGDGKAHLHEEDAVALSCADCHVQDTPNTLTYDALDAESKLVFMHRNYDHADRPIVKVARDGHPLVNTFINDHGQVIVIGKKEGKQFVAKKQRKECSKEAAHQSVSCASCHSQWAPRCIGCHNSYDPQATGYDLLDKKMIEGTWLEHVFEFDQGLPSLGVRIGLNGKTFEPAIPGMILSIDPTQHPDTTDKNVSFHRLYAPNAPHTTSKEVRSCNSCHTDPSALGYGKGVLTFVQHGRSGNWYFEPDYEANPIDGLPEDAWIPFLKDPKEGSYSTRSDFRPLNSTEQKNMLRVGTCLQCHQPESEVMTTALKTGIKPLLMNMGEQCALPDF